MNSSVVKEVRYLNKDFASLRSSLIDFAKIYYPNTYQNFNESSIGMLFIELSAYVGDVLSYYIDDSLKESMLMYADELKNLYALAQAHGYKPQTSIPAYVDLDVFQLVPSIGSGANIGPDWSYALRLQDNMQVASEENFNVIFRTLEPVNFAVSSSIDSTEVTVFEVDGSNNPAYYLLKKSVKAVAGEVKETVFTFGEVEKYAKKLLPDENIIEILNATDSNGNVWYHVPFLAQDTIFVEEENLSTTDPELSQYSNTVPYLLKLRKTARRFTSYIRSDGRVELQFGAGISNNPDELIVPNPTNIGSNLYGAVSFSDVPLDPANFMYTKTYGQAPANTSLTVKYVVGGGIESNVNQNTIKQVRDVTITNDFTGLDSDVVTTVKDSVGVNNPIAARGGRGGETAEEIRLNTLAHYAAQLRAVTKSDYITRVYSMPGRFGSVAKAYIVQDDQLNVGNIAPTTTNGVTRVTNAAVRVGNEDRVPNPLALNLYTLGYNSNKKLSTLNQAIKENLKIYLSQYRMLTDAINIKDGYIVNISIRFQIIAFKSYNKREVVLQCIRKLKEYFNIDNWQFNQPIIISDIYRELFSVVGVQSVVQVDIVNKYKESEGYSGNIYDIQAATRDGIVYPSVDPCVFEVKYPDLDIQGRSL